MSTIARGMAQSAKEVLDNPYAGKETIDAEMLQELEAYARNLGITVIEEPLPIQ